MVSSILQERFDEIERLAIAMGLKPFDVHFFEVPAMMIWQVASYGLPTRYSHWTHGRAFDHHRTQGEMGFSKIYELVLNSSPSYAFLDKSNSDTMNLLVCAHVIGHSHVFANNIMFHKYREPDIISTAKHHAEMIDKFRRDYGEDEVDNWLDIALAFERHIDMYRGFERKRYPKKKISYESRAVNEWEDVVYGLKKEPMLKKTVTGMSIPPYLEKDILWFLSEYAHLEDWQKRIFEIVRRESYYFFPQAQTKILNEGLASFVHAEIMRQYALGNDNDYGVTDIKHPLTSEEHLDFARAHEKVVQPGFKIHLKVKTADPDTGEETMIWNPHVSSNPRLFNAAIRLNPYYVGFSILMDIRKRWDHYFEEGYIENEWGEKIPVTQNGLQKVIEVVDTENDVSLFRNYLTDELCEKLHLFAYGNNELYDDTWDIQDSINKRITEKGVDQLGKSTVDKQWIENQTIKAQSKDRKDIIQNFARDMANYGVPNIVIRRVSSDGTLRCEHVVDDAINIDIKYAEHVLRYLYATWNRPVELIRKVPKKDVTWILRYDGSRLSKEHETLDYVDILESMEGPSSL